MMFQKKFDTVIMNPPFGTKNNKGMVFMRYDLEFWPLKFRKKAFYDIFHVYKSSALCLG